MFKIFIITTILVGLAIIGFAFNIILKKNGKFPTFHIGENEEMKKRGISCSKCEDMGTCNIDIKKTEN